jgi:hypothetical protein
MTLSFHLFLSLSVLFASSQTTRTTQPINPCDIYGQIYEEKDRRRAQFLVYVEQENEFRSNVVVYKESNLAFADAKGLWYFTNNRGFADYAVHFVEDRSIADFVIYYTDKPHYAGCR